MSMQNALYDDFDDVLDIVNSGFERRRQEQAQRDEKQKIKREKEINGAVLMIDAALERSIREEDWRIQTQKTAEAAEEKYRKNFKRTIIAVLLGAALVSPFALKAGESIINKYNHWTSVNSAVAVQSVEVRDNLMTNRLAYVDMSKVENLEHVSYEVTPFTVRDNSVEDYKVLNVKDYVDVYLYMINLPETEFRDFIRSITYVDTNGSVCYYENFEQYLRINGFPDERTFTNYGREGAYQREVQRQQRQVSTISEGSHKGGRS